MKPSLKPIVIVLSLLLAWVAFMPRGQSQQNPPAPIQAVEQYKVLDMNKYTTPLQLEIDLNKLGTAGWKVRTSTPGGLLILSRPG